jgi:hypothetical protein
LELERSSVDNLHETIKKENELFARNKDEVAFLEAFCATEIARHKEEIVEICTRVSAIVRADIYTLKGISEPSECILSILEAVMLLLKHELRPGESSWDSAKRLISEKGFLNRLISISEDSTTVTNVVLHTVVRITKSDEFNSKDLKDFVSIILRDWVNIFTNQQLTKFSIIPKQKLIQETEAKIATRKAALFQYEQDLTDHEQKMKNLRILYSSTVKNNEELNVRTKEIEKKLSNSSSIEGSVDLLKKAFHSKREKDVEFQRKILSLSLIFSCKICFLSTNRVAVKSFMVSQWLKNFPQFHLEEIPDLSFVQIADPFQKRNREVADEFIEMIFSTQFYDAIPIFVDPFDIIGSVLYQSGICSYINILDGESDNFQDRILALSKDPGGIAIKFNTDKSISTLYRVKNYILSLSRSTNQRIFFLVNNFIPTEFHFDDEFKRFNVYYHEKDLTRRIQNAVASVHNSELRSKFTSKRIELASAKLKAEQVFNSTAKILNSIDPTEIFSSELSKGIIDCQSSVDSTIFRKTQIEKALGSLTVEMKLYTLIGETLSRIFLVFHNMHYISQNYIYYFDDFSVICTDKAASIGLQLGKPEAKNYCEDIYRAAFLNVAPGLKAIHKIVLSFFLSQEVCDISLFDKDNGSKFDVEHLEFLFKIPERYGTPAVKNYSKQWLSDDKWESILKLTNIHPFQRFANEFSKFANRATTPITEISWQDVFESKDPTKGEIPSKWQLLLNRTERMTVINLLRPDCLRFILIDFSKLVLGNTVLEAGFPAFNLLQRYRFSNPAKSISVINDSNREAATMIHNCTLRLSMESPLVITEANIDQKDLIIEAINKGLWVIVDFTSNFEDPTPIIRKMTKYQLEQPIKHGMFRMWYIFEPNTNIPFFLNLSTVKVYLEESSDFRGIFGECFSTLYKKSGLLNGQGSSSMRQLIFNYTTLISILKYHMRCVPMTPQHDLLLTSTTLENSIDTIIELFSSNTYSLQNSKHLDILFEKVFMVNEGMQICCETDLKWCRAMFVTFCHIDWDEQQEKNSKLPPLKEIYELFFANEYSAAFEKLNSIPRIPDLNLSTLGFSENTLLYFGNADRKELLNAMNLYKPEIVQDISLQILKEDAIKNLEQFVIRLRSESNKSWFNSLDQKVTRPQGARGVKTALKMFESYSRNNFQKYRAMVKFILENLEMIVTYLKNSERFLPWEKEIYDDIYEDKIPDYWLKSGYFYETNLNLTDFMADFIERLEFCKEWHSSKFEGKASDALIFYDISKVFCPGDFFAGKYE